MSSKLIIFILITFIRCNWARLSARLVRDLPQNVPLTLVEWPSYNILEPEGPGTYAFGYELEDPSSGNVQFRDEEKLMNGTIRGSYGYLRPDGLISLTRYIADQNGYRSETETFKKPSKVQANTTTQSPSMMSTTSSSTMYENFLSPEIISPEVAQALLDQHQIDLKPTEENLVDPDVADIINGIQPLHMISQEHNKKLGIQLVNNFIPNNSPVISLYIPNKEKSSEDVVYDSVDGLAMIENDKFYNPIIHQRKDNTVKKKMAETKEAQWYKELIRNRRKEFLQKYAGSNYNDHTIPPDYINSRH